jgi:hypothetical protein
MVPGYFGSRFRAQFSLSFWWQLVRGFDHSIQHLQKIAEPGGRHDNGVAPRADVFRDAQQAAARIFFQGELEQFALDLDLSAFEGVFLDEWFRGKLAGRPWRLRPPTVWLFM